MVINDLIEVASGLDNSLLKFQEKNIHDLRQLFTIGITLPKEELRILDHDLYVTQNGNSDGFTESDEVRAKILGIDFVIVPEEEEADES